MKIISETSLEDFKAWSGAVTTLDRIINEGKCDNLEAILEEQYPEGMTDTQLNDILWFEDEWCYEMCGIRSETAIRNELKEAEEELDTLKSDYESECEDEEMTHEEKVELWENDYADDAKELEEKVAELKEELENI